jgi:hypothetical protein
VESLLGALEGTVIAQTLREARWAYAGLSASHIFGIALLVGAIVPLDLRLLGFWPSVPLSTLVRLLVPLATCGLALAIVTGALLFSVRATQYAQVGFFQAKLLLIALGSVTAFALHARYGRMLETASPRTRFVHALASLTCWLGALLLGRLIGFSQAA